ncbi:MAG: efflux RND transporter permease subunit [Spirochaetota bacterium]
MKRHLIGDAILNHDISIILAFIFLFVLGAVSVIKMPVTSLPRYTEPVLTIVTDFEGRAPSTIEELITRPIEYMLKEVEGIEKFYSFSRKGSSKVVLYLDEGEDIDRKAVMIQDSLYHLSEIFPPDVHQPVIHRYNTDDRPLMIISLIPKGVSDREFELFVEQKLKPQLQSVEGVAFVELSGFGLKEYVIDQKFENIVRMNGNSGSIFEGVVKRNHSSTAGSLKTEYLDIPVNFIGRYRDILSLPFYPLFLDGGVVFGYDLFSVEKRKRGRDELSLVNNSWSFTVYLFGKDFSNILGIDREVRRILKRCEGELSCEYLFNQAESLRDLIRQLEISVALAMLFVFLILLLFYRGCSLAALVVVTVPICISGTLLLMRLFQRSLNLMTLAALVVGVGICVDNTIIMTESIYGNFTGNFRENFEAMSLKNLLRSTMSRSAKPIFSSTLTTVVVFLPVFYFRGSGVSLYTDFALTISMMLFISLLVSSIFIPCFMNRFYDIKAFEASLVRRRERFETNAVSRFILILLRGVLRRPKCVAVLFFLSSGVFCYLFLSLDYEEISPVKENTAEIFYEFDPEYNLSYRIRGMKEMGEEILGFIHPLTMVSKLDGSRISFFLRFPHDFKKLKEKVLRLNEQLQRRRRGDGFFFFPESTETGRRSIRVYFYGDELEELGRFVDRMAGEIAGFEGVQQVLKGYREGKPEMVFLIDPRAMYYRGLDVSGVIRFMGYIFHQPVIMKNITEEGVFDVRGKIGVDQLRMDSLHSLSIQNQKGELIPLSDFTRLSYSEGPGVISRKNGKRYISVDVQFRDLTETEMAEKIEIHLDNAQFDRDFYYEFDEELLNRKQSSLNFIIALCLAVFLVYVVLGVTLNSFRLPLAILSTIPSFFIGSFIFLRAGNYGRTIPAHIALILLVGLSVNCSIVIAEEIGHGVVLEDEVISGYKMKLRLIVLMLLTTVFSLVPVYFLATSTYFFKILTGVIFSGTFVGVSFSLIAFAAFCKVFRIKGA